jgi:uncharacterized coiled-coil DUF342 family protein
MATAKEQADELRRKADELEAGLPPDAKSLIEKLVENLAKLTSRVNHLEDRLEAMESKLL